MGLGWSLASIFARSLADRTVLVEGQNDLAEGTDPQGAGTRAGAGVVHCDRCRCLKRMFTPQSLVQVLESL